MLNQMSKKNFRRLAIVIAIVCFIVGWAAGGANALTPHQKHRYERLTDIEWLPCFSEGQLSCIYDKKHDHGVWLDRRSFINKPNGVSVRISHKLAHKLLREDHPSDADIRDAILHAA